MTQQEPTPPPPPPAPDKLDGVVERIIFHNPDTAYTVARLVPDGAAEAVVIVGTLPAATPGEALHLRGKWTTNPQHGRQFEFIDHAPVLPKTALGIEKYLGSGLVKGVGPVSAKRLVERFGIEIIEILDRAPERLREVPGIGPKRAADIAQAWRAQTALRETMIFLQSIGISVAHAARLTRLHGPETARLIQQDPYRLLLDVRGLGFTTVDKIAEKMGIGRDAPMRLRAGLEHVLDRFTEDGHVFAPLGDLLQEAQHILGAPREALEDALAALASEQRVVLDAEPSGRRVVYPARLHRAEQAVAFRLAQLISTKRPLLAGDHSARLAQFERDFKFHFAEQQRTALLTALQGGVVVITGGPGTGKTTLLRALLRMLEGTGTRTLLCAPTGRAAKRMGEAARRQAQTIHRLLHYSPGQRSFQRNTDNPLAADLVVVDEASMLDLALAADLLEAIPPGCALLLIGDVDQLPAVGPGSVLRDLIGSGHVPVIRLSVIFRQAQRSAIIFNAHRVNRGEFPLFPETEEQRRHSDMFFVEKIDPQEALGAIQSLVQERIPNRFHLDSLRDIQVISPMRRGSLGTVALNAALQALLNRDSRPLMRGGRLWKTGDKVMQITNNYEKDVFNGDLGFIVRIDPEDQCLTVRYAHRVVDYGFDELDEIELAYAITVHKSQGSEFPAVVLALHTQHHVMLQRNLLYTAITRGQRLVTIVGSRRALARAVREASHSQRLSGLPRRLDALLR